jgi:BRCT domain type II-containing protein
VRRLITQWGGRLADEVNVNTDFIVLGAQPGGAGADDEDTATDIERRAAAERR